ncbi:glycosyltransferase [Nodosilinea sp. LEGE 07298]|uniref:glycosyltransferase family 2 protein n=1 Tax=Nodosilinea sp. LEGE 07298 TaxID=2777970 RepID=UPI0018802A8C|nr:glycosyltransferase family 2 protein [Nodosilinea sp. LEGE 07298]MBE9111568.1 glycosyltransferase [Nodosilinea sp. LEGE 07298]
MSQIIPEPKISIIVPSLNQGEYLRQCIESILSQQYSDLELIIIDGNSTDQSVEIIREYAEHISTWVSEHDLGQSDAINKGFKQATGDIVAWLNADDFYLPKSFQRIKDAYQANPSSPFYFGDGLRVDKSGEAISRFFPTEKVLFDRQALVMGLNYILQPSTFINRKALEKVGYLDINLHYGMDSDLWMRLSSIGVPQAVQSPLAASREYETTKTATGSFARVEELRNISMKYSGLPITPGVICYFLDTLYRVVQENHSIFPKAYSKDIVFFWKKTQSLLSLFDARPDGFPQQSKLDK